MDTSNLSTTEVKLIWVNSKRLSWLLEHGTETEHPRKSMAQFCHQIQADLALLTAQLEGWKKEDLERLEEKGIIDQYDKGFLKRIL